MLVLAIEESSGYKPHQQPRQGESNIYFDTSSTPSYQYHNFHSHYAFVADVGGGDADKFSRKTYIANRPPDYEVTSSTG